VKEKKFTKMPRNNKEYCRNWHAKNRERSRELAKEYYQRISKPIEPLKSQKEVNKILKHNSECFLYDLEVEKWSLRHWRIFEKLTD